MHCFLADKDNPMPTVNSENVSFTNYVMIIVLYNIIIHNLFFITWVVFKIFIFRL